MQEVIDLAQHLFKQANIRITTSKLNEAIERIVAERMPSFPGGRKPKIYYATQTGVAPPTIVLFVNQPEHVMESYQRYVVNRMRELLPFDEVPIHLQIRGRSGRDVARDADKGTERFIDETAPQLPRGKSGGKAAVKHGEKSAKKLPKQISPRVSKKPAKPQPKKAGLRGAARGTRPR